MYEAKLYGTTEDWDTGFLSDSEASEVRFFPGVMEVAILERAGHHGVQLAAGERLHYIGELDILFKPGSDVGFWWNLRNGQPSEGGIALHLNTHGQEGAACS